MAKKKIRFEWKYTGLYKPWKLSRELSQLLGMDVATKQQLQKLLRKYVKANDLHDQRDRRFFYPDATLLKLTRLGTRPDPGAPVRVEKWHQHIPHHLLLLSKEEKARYELEHPIN